MKTSKLQNFKTKLLSVLILSTLLFACSKLEQTYPSKGSNTIENRTTLDPDDFTYIGVQHNAALDYLTSQVHVDTASDQTKRFHIYQYFYGQATSDSARTILTYYYNNPLNFNEGALYGVNWLTYCGSNYSTRERYYLTKITNFAVNATNGTNHSDSLAVLEAQLVTDTTRSLRKVMLLGTTSIARSSYYYWENAYNTSNHPYYSQVHLGNQNPIGFWISPWIIKDIVAYVNCMGFDPTQKPSYPVWNQVCGNQATYESAR